MEEIRQFQGGINKDININNQPPNTYRNAENFIQISEDGNIAGITTEKGFVDKQINFPPSFSLVGQTVLEDEVIVFLSNGVASQIGSVDPVNLLYTRNVPGDDGDDTNNELNFNVFNPIDATARKLFTGERVVYFTDNVNKMRFVNLDNPPTVGEIDDNTGVIPEQLIPQIDLKGIEEVSGNLGVGIHYFVTRYLNADLTPTTYGIPSAGVPIVDEVRAGGALNYDGEYPDYGKVNKSIELSISNIDTSYPYIQLVAVYYAGITNTFTADALPIRNVTGGTMSFSYAGTEENVTEVTLEELRTIPVSYTTAKAVTQKDDILFWSNLKDSSLEFDEQLQELANDCEIRYSITEVPYADRLGEAAPFFSLAVSPYIKEVDTTPENRTIVLVFTNPPDPQQALLESYYEITYAGDTALGVVNIDDSTLLYDGGVSDTITIGATVFTALNTAVTPGDGTFDASGDNEATAASLSAQISAHPVASTIFTADAVNDRVDVRLIVAGSAGNSKVLTYTNNAGSPGASVIGFTGGTDDTVADIESITEAGNVVEIVMVDPLAGRTLLSINSLPDNTGSTTLTVTDRLVSTFPIDPDIGTTNDGSFNGYKDEASTYYKKGYRRNEVYSLGMIVTFKDGGQSFTYPIAGNNKTAIPAGSNFFPAVKDSAPYTNLGGLVGTYVSETDYPLNQFFPGDRPGDDTSFSTSLAKIRHHKMPSLEQEPHFRKEGDQRYIRILGLDIKLNKEMTDELADKIQSISFVRQRRNSPQNKSVIMQGLPSRYVEFDRDYTSDGDGSNPAFKKMPFFNNTSITQTQVDITGLGTFKDSIAFDYRNVQDKKMAFYSPDTLLVNTDPADVVGGKLIPVLGLEGEVIGESLDFIRSRQRGVINAASNLESDLDKYLQAWAGLNLNNPTAPLGTSAPTIVASQYIPSRQEATVTSLSATIPIDNKVSSRHMYLETADTESAVSFGVTGQVNVNFKSEIFNEGATIFINNNETVYNSDTFTAGPQTQNLLSLETTNNTQYAEIGSGPYMIIHTSKQLPTSPGVEYKEIFEGDTFIGGFAFRNADVYYYQGLRGVSYRGIRDTSYIRGNTTNWQAFYEPGMDLRSFTYMFVESDVNVEYRHQYIDRSDPDNPKSEANYYPRATGQEVNEVFPNEDDSSGYNTQYSFEQTLKSYNAKTAQATIVGDFETRTIYSERAVIDESIDSFRLYPQNNYHDLPKDTGEIWDNFVHANILYLHTPKTLYRTYVNDVTQQATNLGQVVLGVGALFAIPSKPVITTEGGYGGTISQWGGVNTPFGYMFPDALQGKVFLLTGEQLSDIGNKGLMQFFHNNLGTSLSFSSGQYLDVPTANIGLTSGYDFTHSRILLTKGDGLDGRGFTLSFSYLSKVWVSFHSYQPVSYVSINKELYNFKSDLAISTLKMYEHDAGVYGSYYNEIAPASLDLVFNANAASEKVFDNFVLHTRSYNEDEDVVVKLDTFDTVEAETDTRATDVYNLQPVGVMSPRVADQLRAVFLKSKYQIAIPGDAVINDDLAITPANLNKDALFKQRMKGDYLRVRFVYNNNDNYKFVVNFVGLRYRTNAN